MDVCDESAYGGGFRRGRGPSEKLGKLRIIMVIRLMEE